MNTITLILNSNIINFLLVLGFIYWVVKKVDFLALLQKKSDEVKDVISNSDEQKIDKDNLLSAAKNNVSNLQTEVDNIMSEGKQIADRLADAINTDASQKANDLHNKAIVSIEGESQKASGEIMTQLTKAAFVVAEEHIKQAIDERLHQKFINDFIENLHEQEVKQ